MDKYRPIFSKAITLSRMNSSQTNRKAPSFCRLHTNSDSKSTVSPIFSVEQNQSFHRYSAQCNSFRRSFASAAGTETQQLSQLDFEQYCAETLESLTDYFDELVEKFKEFEAADVVYKDGVLTVNLGHTYGTYVINKQTPNKQIWLSSPFSGPKRFDYVSSSNGSSSGHWIYKHTDTALHELLDKEFSEIVSAQTAFQQLPFGLRQ